MEYSLRIQENESAFIYLYGKIYSIPEIKKEKAVSSREICIVYAAFSIIESKKSKNIYLRLLIFA